MIRDLVAKLMAISSHMRGGEGASKKIREHYAKRVELAEMVNDLRIERNKLKEENHLYEEALKKMPSYEYGSLVPSKKEWLEKWRRNDVCRVLMIAPRDYAGSFVKWAEAVHVCTDMAAKLVTFEAHEYGYDVDLLLPMPNLARACSRRIQNMGNGLKELIDEADVLHIKDEKGFWDGSNGLDKEVVYNANKPIVYTLYGGFSRKLCDDESFRSYVNEHSACVAMTPDLVFPWLKPNLVPHAIDIRKYPYCWVDGEKIVHSPSTKERKGTRLLEEAASRNGYDLDIISGVTHKECIERKSRANLFFDQAGREMESRLGTSKVIGWYGNSAIEAAVFGIPTIAHMSEESFGRAASVGEDIRERCAIINTGTEVDDMGATLNWYFGLSKEARKTLSLETRRWVESFHSYEICADKLDRVYRKVLMAGGQRPTEPRGPDRRAGQPDPRPA